MVKIRAMRKFIFIVTGLLFLAGTCLKADGVTFKASAPDAVVMGQQFQLTYTVNEPIRSEPH